MCVEKRRKLSIYNCSVNSEQYQLNQIRVQKTSRNLTKEPLIVLDFIGESVLTEYN